MTTQLTRLVSVSPKLVLSLLARSKGIRMNLTDDTSDVEGKMLKMRFALSYIALSRGLEQDLKLVNDVNW